MSAENFITPQYMCCSFKELACRQAGLIRQIYGQLLFYSKFSNKYFEIIDIIQIFVELNE